MSAPTTLVQSARRTPANVALVPIDPALAKRVRAAAQAAEKKRQERDDLILKAHADGASLREIGALVGLSHVGVMKIVNKGTSLAEALLAEQLAEHMASGLTPEQARSQVIRDGQQS